MPKRISLNTKMVCRSEKTPIDLRWIFPEALAAVLLSKAQSDRADPVRSLQTLLPVMGTVLGSRIGIELNKGYSVEDSHIDIRFSSRPTSATPVPAAGRKGFCLSRCRKCKMLSMNGWQRLLLSLSS